MNTFDLVLAIFVSLFAIAATVYGYINYMKTKSNEDLRWIYVGIVFIVLVIFNTLTTYVFTFSPAVAEVLHWVRLVCDAGAVIYALTLKVRK